MDDRDIFSYDNSENLGGSTSESFDLNAFSSVLEPENGNQNAKGKKKKKKRSAKEKILRGILTVFLIGLITVSLVVSAFLFYAFTMVDGTMEQNLDDLELNFTTTIYVKDDAGNDVEYQRLHGEFNRIWVSYDEKAAKELQEGYTGIPQNLVNAFISIEDKRFFEHSGVDWKRTFSSFANLFFHFYSSNQGGSTITQQLVKNLTGDSSQKPSRKIREIMRARYFESKYAKNTIMECYLNTIAMGHGTYGVEVASNYYFGKHVSDLTLSECACLAAITKSPSHFSPDDNPEENRKRRITVLAEMKDQGYITEEEYQAAAEAELTIVADKQALNESDTNSYFIDALIEQVVGDLCDKYGYEKQHANKLFYSGGYRIYTTFDPKIQAAVDAVFTDAKTYSAKGADGQYMQGAITVMDYNGHVKGIAGGIGEKSGNRVLNRAIAAVRQPGSTMKPISAYAPAIEQNLIHYSSIVNDVRTDYGKWTPHNWYGGYWGNITVQYALERSVNTIPVYLVNKMTPQSSYDFLTRKLGIKTLSEEDINLSSLGMGGSHGGLTTTESVGAFAIFGNLGRFHAPTFYTKVTDQYGEIVLEYNQNSSMAISEDTATVMNKLLQQVVYGAHGTGGKAKGYIQHLPVFAKTGTSNDTKDLWFVGGTPYYAASCWCGYDQQQNISNSAIALTMWGQVMSRIHKDLPEKDFPVSSYAVERYYCTSSGELATAACPSKAIGWYRKSNMPGVCKTHGGQALPDPQTLEEQAAKAAEEAEANAQTGESDRQETESASKPADSAAVTQE